MLVYWRVDVYGRCLWQMFMLAGLLPAHKSIDIVEVAHMLDATEHRGVGVGWGVMTSLKLHTC